MKYWFGCFFWLYAMAVYAQQEVKSFLPSQGKGEFGLTVSPNGNHALWVRSNGGRDTLTILESFQKEGKWSEPTVAPFSGNVAWRDIDPVFSPDGKTIFFQSNRPVPTMLDRKGFDIWVVRKVGKTWSLPEHLGNVLNTDASESFASATEKGNLYFMKENENKVGQSDIYVSRFVDGAYLPAENVGLPINTHERESNPYISPKEDFLIFFSSTPKGLGDVDLFISFKKGNTWTEPIALGVPINSKVGEFCPFVHQKQNRLYFSRTEMVGKRRIEGIYYIEGIKQLIQKLKKQAFAK